MAKIKIPIKIISFVHKDTGAIESFCFDKSRDTVDNFEGYIFGEYYNCSRFTKASSCVVNLGHKEIETETVIEIEI